MTGAESAESNSTLGHDHTLEMFKFYEEAAEKTKSHAWSQTTWILSLNAGILAFSLNLYAAHKDVPGFLVIEWISSLAGVVLCLYLYRVIHELGAHIRKYWTHSNRLAANYPPLVPFIDKKDVAAARSPTYRAPFPRFCRRLQYPALLFMVAHLGWACVATWLQGELIAVAVALTAIVVGGAVLWRYEAKMRRQYEEEF